MRYTVTAKRGFTIVELLIVIVVIAILASITLVAFSTMQQRSRNASRIAVGSQWVTVFQVYHASNEVMPPAATAMAVGGKICLGTGFPIGGGGVARCQNVSGTDSNSPAESNNATLMSELATASSLPATEPLRAPVTGPYLQKISAIEYRVMVGLEGAFASGGDCGGGFTVYWTNSTNAAVCGKKI